MNFIGKFKKKPLTAAEDVTGDHNFKDQPNLTGWTSFGFANKDGKLRSGTIIYQHINNMENGKIAYMIVTTTVNCKSSMESNFTIPKPQF